MIFSMTINTCWPGFHNKASLKLSEIWGFSLPKTKKNTRQTGDDDANFGRSFDGFLGRHWADRAWNLLVEIEDMEVSLGTFPKQKTLELLLMVQKSGKLTSWGW